MSATRVVLSKVSWILFGCLLLTSCDAERSSGASADTVCSVASPARACTCSDGSASQSRCEAGSWSACACSVPDAGAGSTPATPSSPVSPPASTSSGATQTVTNGSALPCEISTLLSARCGHCHGRDNQSPAPMKLETWADLHAATPSDARKKVFESALARVQDDARPMPPASFGARVSASEIAALKTWVEGGAKSANAGQSCASTVTVDAGVTPPPATIDGSGSPDDCEQYHELRVHRPESKDMPFEVPSAPGVDGNNYHCFYFGTDSYPADSQGLWFKSLADNKKILHHWLLYASDFDAVHAPGSDAPCSAAEPGAYLIAGWAPGAPDYKPPPDVGLSLPHGPDARLILEVHWYNDSGTPQPDRSGVRFCTAKAGTRPHTAGVHFTGGEGICLQPGQPQDVTGMCAPDVSEEIHLLRVWPHMHKLGRRMKVTLLRASGGREVLHDGAFDFEDQRAYDLDDVVMRAGDQLETVCSYMNTTNAPVPFGEDTQEEMCFGFITAWPAGALVNSVLDLSSWIGGPLQPARRCLDPLGILNSCNGLGDYPPPGG